MTEITSGEEEMRTIVGTLAQELVDARGAAERVEGVLDDRHCVEFKKLVVEGGERGRRRGKGVRPPRLLFYRSTRRNAEDSRRLERLTDFVIFNELGVQSRSIIKDT